MTAVQKPETGARSTTVSTAAQAAGRKAWKKRTPVEVVRDQVVKLREEVATKKAEFNEAERQLKKLEEAVKVLEGT